MPRLLKWDVSSHGAGRRGIDLALFLVRATCPAARRCVVVTARGGLLLPGGGSSASEAALSFVTGSEGNACAAFVSALGAPLSACFGGESRRGVYEPPWSLAPLRPTEWHRCGSGQSRVSRQRATRTVEVHFQNHLCIILTSATPLPEDAISSSK